MRPLRPVVSYLAVSTALAIAGLVASPLPGQEKPSPIVSKVKAALQDPTRPFTLLVSFQAKEGAGEKIEAAFAKAVRETRREKGCLAYDFSRDAKTPSRYVVYERWQNLAALAAHLRSAHITTMQKEVAGLRVAPDVQVLVPVGE
jgi:quinol monooxygenase YgiN